MSSCKSMDFSDDEISGFVDAANRAADVAGEIIRKYYESELMMFEGEKKNGSGRVTILAAKREAEKAMVSIILENFPAAHAVYGKETGWSNIDSSSQSSLVWVLDAIYGARKDFQAGFRLFSFGTMIALLHNGKPLLGCIDQPPRKLRWMGVKGKSTTLNQDQVLTDDCENLGMAYANLKAPYMGDDARIAFDRLSYKVYISFFDTTCTVYGALACGQLHLVVDCDLSPWNFLAAVPIVEGAGGIITDWEGRELCWNATPSDEILEGGFKVVAAGDRKTHQQVIDSLSY